MSFIITVYTSEGIVMASDSRSTYNFTKQLGNGNFETLCGAQITDTTYKTFQCNEHIGISTCGDASINQTPIAGYIEKFIHERVNADSSVGQVSNDLLNYFSNVNPHLNTHFIIAGYDSNNTLPVVKQLFVADQSIKNFSTNFSGAVWDGETATLSKLFTQLYAKNPDETYCAIQNHGINFSFFNLQDAINFAQYAVDVTIKTMAFENCVKTVGGPVDILVIKPTESFWVARKELHA